MFADATTDTLSQHIDEIVHLGGIISQMKRQKIKKESGVPEIHLEPTPDVLRELAGMADRPVLVGFAAETNDLETAGRRKLEDKHLDLVVVNEVGREGTGFGSETNDAMILSSTGDDVPLRTWTKRELADAILDRLGKLVAQRG